MATIDIWIQIENHAWDTVPHRFDRMTGQDFNSGSVLVNLTSPVTGHTRNNVRMYKPLLDGANVGEALILRRYTANWAAPDDRKVNPWDLNEPDPTDNGTMGTIPGPVIECNVGDGVRVHFRNKDSRAGKSPKARTHSLHPHGFVFKPTSDGAESAEGIAPRTLQVLRITWRGDRAGARIRQSPGLLAHPVSS